MLMLMMKVRGMGKKMKSREFELSSQTGAWRRDRCVKSLVGEYKRQRSKASFNMWNMKNILD